VPETVGLTETVAEPVCVADMHSVVDCVDVSEDREDGDDAALSDGQELDGVSEKVGDTELPDMEGVNEEHALMDSDMVTVGGVGVESAENVVRRLSLEEMLGLLLELDDAEGDVDSDMDWLADAVMDIVIGGTSQTRMVKGWLHEPA
jgi:hypothetical protein